MEAKELRIGNLVYYHIEDSMDERKEWDKVSLIDYDDIRCFVQYEDNSEYRPIPLTEEWLLKFGLIKKYLEDELEPDGYYLDDDGNRWYSWVDGGVFTLEIQPDGEIWFELYSHYQHIQYVHQIQNLYFALTGEELTQKQINTEVEQDHYKKTQ